MTDKIHKPLVTIGILTYNRADSYLQTALNSALGQTYPNIEIIVADNCSNDNTEEYVTSFSDPRLRYYKQKENIGRVGNTAYCLEQARGDYFMLLHDDDIIDDDFIETCMAEAGYSSDIGIIQTGTRVIDGDGNTIHEYPNRSGGGSTEDYFRAWFTCKSAWYLCSTLYNTRGLREIGGYKSKRYHFDDVTATVQLAAKYGRVDIQSIKASFRKHMGEATFSVTVKNWCDDSNYLLDLMCSLVDEKNRTTITQEGIRFLSAINYNFAKAVKSPLKRLMAYMEVYRAFNYKHIPPPVRSFFYSKPLYYGSRLIKGK